MGDGHDITNVSTTFFFRYGGMVPDLITSSRNLMWIKTDSNTYDGSDMFNVTLQEFMDLGE